MNKNSKIHHSFRFAMEGVIHAFRYNRNIRIHMVVGILVLAAGFLLGLTKFEWLIVLIVILVVFVSEMINTAIEEMVDLITNEHRREAKIAKDVAAGMVLVSAIGAIIIGIAVFAPYFIEIL